MQCIDYFKQFVSKCGVPIRFPKHIPIGSYSNSIPYLILVFFMFRVEIVPILDLMNCTLVLLSHTHGGEWVNSQMGSAVVAIQEIGVEPPCIEEIACLSCTAKLLL